MGHNLDIITGTDGREHVNFVSKNLVAWHGLGEVFAGMNLSVEQGMDLSNLNGWNVRKVPLVAQELTEDGVTTFEEPGVFQVRRTNPITKASERLGSVGTEFTHIQNEEAAEYFAALLGETGAGVETMGALDGGRRTFFCAKLPQGINVGGADPHDLYVALLNGHVGDSALRTIITPVRIVCANTEAAAIGRASQSWSIRHTKNAKAALEAAKQSTEKAWAFLEAYDEEATKMLETEATFAHVQKAAERLWPLPKYIDPEDPTAGERANATASSGSRSCAGCGRAPPRRRSRAPGGPRTTCSPSTWTTTPRPPVRTTPPAASPGPPRPCSRPGSTSRTTRGAS